MRYQLEKEKERQKESKREKEREKYVWKKLEEIEELSEINVVGERHERRTAAGNFCQP